MKDIPDDEINGTITAFNLEASADGSAVLVAYTKDAGGRIGKSWLHFEPESVSALRNAVRHRLPEESA
ncbi:hypothetical protein OG618_37590 (plasmid) [Kitasatospora sp. NBC_01246]|uniref:hypothetical protein n=1 Tax=Kitasatospora sp. NBC_01246 TaxID=2903570 RepID=UPI002E2F40B5|nr:hypothetical protein [Kitasatospora sp. NBC_01246]